MLLLNGNGALAWRRGAQSGRCCQQGGIPQGLSVSTTTAPLFQTFIVKRNAAGLATTRPTTRQSFHALSSSDRRMVCMSIATPDSADVGVVSGDADVAFSNDIDPNCTVISICGKNESTTLIQLTAVFLANDVTVASANHNSDVEGKVCNQYRVTDGSGAKLPEDRWANLQAQLLRVISSSSRSSMPAIFGAAPDLTTLTAITSEGDVNALESTAAEMADAATNLVSLERELITLLAQGADQMKLDVKHAQRSEASSLLERKMAAMEAILISRRKLVEEARLATEPSIPAFFQPPPVASRTTGPGAGNGYEIILQGFNWESCKEPWYKKLTSMAPEIAEVGFTAIWLPPSSDAVSPQGYLPRDLYDLNCKYGSEAELRQLIATLHEHRLKAIADIVINHRCAHYQGDDKKWNKFGGRLAWDKTVICSNNPAFGGKGGFKNQEDYPAAPNLDHSQERVRKDITDWMRWLRNSIGFDGWRFDFVKGYDGKYVGEYVNATVPELAFGEYWDTCSYTDGVLSYNQDAHRQRTVDWCDATGATTAAFDFTLKGILQEAVTRKEYWRLIDGQGKPSGMLGLWPSRAVTFLENHDTGSTLQHWPFPWQHVAEGYAYLLTHPGTPCVFFDHFYYDESLKKTITKLVQLRKRAGLHYKSEVVIRKTYNDLYAAVVDKKVAVKIGPGNWAPTDGANDGIQWTLVHSGFNFAVWEAVK